MHLQPVAKQEYERYLLEAAEVGLRDWRKVVEDWKRSERSYVLWGYNPPQMPLRLAHLLTYLRRNGLLGPEATGSALEILHHYAELRDGAGEDLASSRAETRGRKLPLFLNTFGIPVLAATLDNLRHCAEADAAELEWLGRELALTVEPVFSHPEWGAMNRAILRSCGLWYAASLLPEHPAATRWRQMAEIIAADNLDRWEIEDASTYHPIWLLYTIWYLELRGQRRRIGSPVYRWYFDYFSRLIAPHGTIPDFGDGDWRSAWFNFVPCFEAAAAELREPHYRWAAARIFRSCSEGRTHERIHLAEVASLLTLAHRWSDDSVPAEPPQEGSMEMLDDTIGKKVVFRTGWGPEDTYLLLNYREEPESGWLDRWYLRDTIPVEEEKMHHGHSDENSIAMLMSGGSVLLHDAGYRSGLPSGSFGAYRADYFHNRLVVRNVALAKEQGLFELLRNSGAYRAVRTQKIDFARLAKVDYSRTRLIDERQGYVWDRVIIFFRRDGEFLVVDGFSPLREDYFTVACLWHTQQVWRRENELIVGGYTRLAQEELKQDRRLMIRFAASPRGRQRGLFEIERHYATEYCFHEAQSGHFLRGRWSIFVTHLAPLGSSEDWETRARAVEPVPTSWDDGAVAFRFRGRDGIPSTLLIKLDLDRERLSENVRPRYSYASGAVSAGELETDAHFAHVWEDEAGIGYSATVLTGLHWKGKALLEVPKGTFGLQLDGGPDREAQAKWRAWNGRVPG